VVNLGKGLRQVIRDRLEKNTPDGKERRLHGQVTQDVHVLTTFLLAVSGDVPRSREFSECNLNWALLIPVAPDKELESWRRPQ